jgi:hypothetical protein
MKVKINSSNKQVLNELTQEEYDFVSEALEIPPSELPFSNIFGDKYRILGNFEVVNDKHPLSKIIKFIEERGWSLEPHVDKQPLKFTKSYKVIRPTKDMTEVDTSPRTKTITLTMQKIIQNMVKAFGQSLPTMYERYEQLTDAVREANNKVSGAGGSDQDIDELVAARNKLQKQQVPIAVKLRNIVSMYAGPREAYQPLNNIAKKDSYLSDYLLNKSKEYYQITTDEAQMYKWQESFSGLYKPAYVIFSRHPVDVYRMSDFTEIRSCHSPPSKKVGEKTFDQYNICALAEAYANGMISYVVTEEEFQKNDMEPTQETLDEYEDGELFLDRERGEGRIVPRSRIRIRRGAYTDPDTGNVTPLAVPDQKVYGLDVGGFKEYVRDYIANIQKDDIEKIFPSMVGGMEDGSTIIELDNFERFGGSYEDSGMAVRQNLPLMFASALDLDPVKLVSYGYLKYDKTLEKELRTQTDEEMVGQDLGQVQEEAENIAQNASMDMRWWWQVSVDEDYDDSISIDSVAPFVYVRLPEETDVANNFREVNEVFVDYKDSFSLPYGNDIIEPEIIDAFSGGQDPISGYTFRSPFLRIEYPNLQEMARDIGEPFTIVDLQGMLEYLEDSSRNGGMSLSLATDPYVEDGFDAVAAKILGVRGFIDDSDFYLSQVSDAYSTERYKEWEEENNSYDYVGAVEILTDVTYTSTLAIDLSVLQERGGYTPRQAAELLIMLGRDEALQKFLVTEINKECQIAAGNEESWNGTAIPFTITGPDSYSSVEEIFEDDPDGEVDDSFDLRMELDQNDISTKSEKAALAALLEQYDQSEMGELILAFSKPLKAKMQELVPAQAVNENKRRMKVRMLRGK